MWPLSAAADKELLFHMAAQSTGSEGSSAITEITKVTKAVDFIV